jgi:hypothetical protein
MFCFPFLQQRPFPCARAVILVMLPATDVLVCVTGLVVAQVVKIVIFAVLSAYLLALAWGTLVSLYPKPKSATAATK